MKSAQSGLWECTFMGFVMILGMVLIVTVIGRAAVAGEVWWVYGGTGYASGIRVHFVGKAHWFTNGEPVPGTLATASSFSAFLASFLLAYLILYFVRYVYRLGRREKEGNDGF